jgi:hypothetical protein
MKKNKENKNQKQGHDVKTPSPPQVMDPSAAPDDQMPKQNSASSDSSPKKGKKEEDRKLTPNEEL